MKVKTTEMENKNLQMMDVTTLRAVLSDVSKNILPSRFEKAQQPDENTIQLGFRNLEGLIWIELSWDPYSPRLIRINSPEKNGSESTLAKQFQYGLKQKALLEIKQEGFERVVEFGFSLRPNEPIEKYLILELMGRHSNILLLNSNRQVITIGRQVRVNQSRLRPISTGDTYVPPPSLIGIKPTKEESLEKWKARLSLLPITFEKALLETYQGVSPSLCLQIASEKRQEAQEIINLNVKYISIETWKTLYKRWNIWLNDLEKSNFGISFEGSTPYRVWNTSISNLNIKDTNTISLGNYYKDNLELKRFNDIHKKVNKNLIKSKSSEENSLKKQKALFSQVAETNTLKIKADDILSRKNPSKEKIKEAQSMYNRIKKIRRSKSIIIDRINYHKDRIKFINESELFINDLILELNYKTSEKIQIISELKEELEVHLCWSNSQKPEKSHSKKNPIKVLELISPSGLKIQIGRNHKQNEFISMRNSRKGDIWFHAQECPGSHVVLKSSVGNFEENDLQMGADIAAFFSRARESHKVSVVMVPTNQLNRLKGANPGTVTHKGGKILWGNPQQVKKLIDSTL